MSNITFIASFLNIPRFAMSLSTNISWTYSNCIYDRNLLFLRVNSFSYVIVLLSILIKKISAAILGTRTLPNSKYPSPHTMSTFSFLCTSSALLLLGRFSSFQNNCIFHFIYISFLDWSSPPLVTVDVPWYSELSAPDYKGINFQNQTTNFSRTVTLIFFLCSSHLNSSLCVFMDFSS